MKRFLAILLVVMLIGTVSLSTEATDEVNEIIMNESDNESHVPLHGWMFGVGFLPEFPVTVNGQEYNYNEYEEFPLFVNGGITYFPLTYNNAMLLNLIPEYDVNNPLSIAFTKGNPEEPKTIFLKELIKKVEDPLEAQSKDRDTNFYQTHHPRTEKNEPILQANSYGGWYFDHFGINITIDGKELDELLDYPLVYYRNMWYLPLTWHVVTEILGGTMSFDFENGLEVRVNNYFTTLNETENITYTEGVFVRSWAENHTCYIKDDLTISLTTNYHGLVGTAYGNLEIRKGETVIKPQGCFGVYQGTPEFVLAPQFTIDGNKIKTFVSHEYRGQNPKPCIVDMETGNIL
ncbi:MAG: hypothetical protein IKA17_08210 [Clostridia bacterium]|nr:hypothetical protein [Clostridia bacterium]